MSKVVEQIVVPYNRTEHKNYELDKIRVKFDDELMTLKQANIFYYVNGKKHYTFTSVEDFLTKLKAKVLRINNKQISGADIKLFVTLDTIDKSVHDDANKKVRTLSERIGLVKADSNNASDNYVKIKLHGHDKMDFVNKSKIVCYDKSGTQHTFFDEVKAGKTLEEIDKNDFYYDGERVEIIDAEYDYTETKPYSKQVFEAGKVMKKRVVASGYASPDGKTHKEKEVLDSKNLNSSLTFVTPLGKSKISDTKHPGKTKEVKKDKIQSFKVSENGAYISVSIAGEKGNLPVKLEDTSVDGEPIKGKDLLSFVGKKLTIKTPSGEKTTEPLTEEQALCLYDMVKFYEPSKSNDDAMKDNAYLRLTNGHLVKESAVAPISYDLSRTAEYDAYLLILDDGDKCSSYILDAKSIDKLTDAEFTFEGKTYPKTILKKLRRTADYTTADIIQTETKGENNKCQLFVNPKKLAEKQDSLELRSTIYNNFVNDYKAGNYKLDKVSVEGKLEDIQKKNPRVMEADSYEAIDDTENTRDYASLSLNPIQVETKKNGKIKLVSHGPTVNVWKSTIDTYKKLLSTLGAGTIGMMSLPGLFLAAAMPGLVVGAVNAIAAGFVIAPIYYSIKAGVINLNHRKIKDKSEISQKQSEKEVRQELKYLQTIAKDMKHKKYAELTDGEILDRIAVIEKHAMRMAKTDRLVTLKMNKGKGSVDLDNASQAQAFVKEFNKEIKKYNSDLRTEKYKKARYERIKKKVDKKTEKGLVISDKLKNKLANRKEKYDAIASVVAKEKSKINKQQNGEVSISTEVKEDKNYNQERQNIRDLKSYLLLRRDLESAIKDKKSGKVKIDGKEFSVNNVRKFLKHSSCELDKGVKYKGKSFDKFTTNKKMKKHDEEAGLVSVVKSLLQTKETETSSFERVAKADEFKVETPTKVEIPTIKEAETTKEHEVESTKATETTKTEKKSKKKEVAKVVESSAETIKGSKSPEIIKKDTDTSKKSSSLKPTKTTAKKSSSSHENKVDIDKIEVPTSEKSKAKTEDKKTTSTAKKSEEKISSVKNASEETNGKLPVTSVDKGETKSKKTAEKPVAVLSNEKSEKYLNLVDDTKEFMESKSIGSTKKLNFTKTNLLKLKNAMQKYISIKRDFASSLKGLDKSFVAQKRFECKEILQTLKEFIENNKDLLIQLKEEWNLYKSKNPNYEWLTNDFHGGIISTQIEYVDFVYRSSDADIGSNL